MGLLILILALGLGWVVCSADAETAVLNLPGPAAVGASVSPQGSAYGTTSGKDKKTPKKKR